MTIEEIHSALLEGAAAYAELANSLTLAAYVWKDDPGIVAETVSQARVAHRSQGEGLDDLAASLAFFMDAHPASPRTAMEKHVHLGEGQVYNVSSALASLAQEARTKTLGQVAFEAYDASRGGKTWDGKPTPPWEALGDGVRSGWEVASLAAAKQAANANTRDFGPRYDSVEAEIDARMRAISGPAIARGAERLRQVMNHEAEHDTGYVVEALVPEIRELAEAIWRDIEDRSGMTDAIDDHTRDDEILPAWCVLIARASKVARHRSEAGLIEYVIGQLYPVYCIPGGACWLGGGETAGWDAALRTLWDRVVKKPWPAKW